MTDSCAPDPQIEMGLVQLALVADTSRKLNRNKERSSRSAHCNGHSMFLVYIDVSGAIEKHLSTFLE